MARGRVVDFIDLFHVSTEAASAEKRPEKALASDRGWLSLFPRPLLVSMDISRFPRLFACV